ncbi:hypothetical protein [Marinobacter sp.]|uniref:hypothetical protein n=1 Tax=Marinobacter sp. TaxID=50741 RepID=UPI00384A923C
MAWILFLIFAKVTVRKLERNPETKEALGLEFVSGWRIFNIAEALVLPKSLLHRVRGGPLGGLFADAELLREHVNQFDRFLAHLFVWPFALAGVGILVIVALDAFHVFD